METCFYRRLSAEEAKLHLNPLLGELEISTTQDSDGDCGTISLCDKMQDIHVGQNFARLSMERVTIEARNRFTPYVFDDKKRYYSPFHECDEATSLRLLEYFCTGTPPVSVTCLIGHDHDRPNADTVCPKKFVVSPPDEATAVLFATMYRAHSDITQGRPERKEDFLWSIGPLPQTDGFVHVYFAFRTLNSIAFQTELQKEAYQQAVFRHSAFKEWKEHMEQLDARRQKIMEVEFVWQKFGFVTMDEHVWQELGCTAPDEQNDPTKLQLALRGSIVPHTFDLEVDTKDTVLDFLRQWQSEHGAT